MAGLAGLKAPNSPLQASLPVLLCPVQYTQDPAQQQAMLDACSAGCSSPSHTSQTHSEWQLQTLAILCILEVFLQPVRGKINQQGVLETCGVGEARLMDKSCREVYLALCECGLS